MEYEVKTCKAENLQQILDILNDVICNTTALYDYHPRDIEMMKQWFQNKINGNFPIIGIFNPDSSLLGFATYGIFRNFPAYKYSIEHSIFIQKDYRGKGLGKILLNKLMEIAIEQNYHNIIGAIDASNLGSINFHSNHGFIHAGTIKHVGFKFGKWLDLAFYQRLLPTPTNPIDG